MGTEARHGQGESVEKEVNWQVRERLEHSEEGVRGAHPGGGPQHLHRPPGSPEEAQGTSPLPAAATAMQLVGLVDEQQLPALHTSLPPHPF